MPIASGFANLSAFQPFDQTAFYPLRNTAVDPTSATWRANNPSYVFIPNIGINVAQPLTNVSSMFAGNRTFNDPDVAIWDASTFVDMSNMFLNCIAFNQNLGNWQTGSATNVSGMFMGTPFNQNINSWNVSKVTDMSQMFLYASQFNQPLSNWNTSSVLDMSNMFSYSRFNQNINSWDVSKVQSLIGIFEGTSFNQALNNWNTGSVTDFGAVFKYNTVFNQDISSWNVSRGRFFDSMFENATSFNCGQSSGIAHDLMQRFANTGWQTQIAINMGSMFRNASSFNGNINGWCMQGIIYAPSTFATGANANFTVARQPPWGYCPTFYPMRNTSSDQTSQTWRNSNPGYTFTPNLGIVTRNPIRNAYYMFDNSGVNDPSLSEWDTSTFTNMTRMFSNCNFNQPIGNWNVSNVTSTAGMFYFNRAFNQPLGSWNVGNVTDMSYMFSYCNFFNQNIGSWDVSRVINMEGMFLQAVRFNCGEDNGVVNTNMQRTATGGWRTNSVFNFEVMFSHAFACAVNISNWCTTASAYGTRYPVNFSENTQISFASTPRWGTCPIP